MQQYENQEILYSPTDLLTFLGCHHASFLDIKSVTEEMETSEDSALNQLLQKKGYEHEAAYLKKLKDECETVVEIPKDRSLQERAKLTIDSMNAGTDAIFQAVFFDAPWRGDADFLIKCDSPSKFGQYSYEVLDTKLARRATPKHIIQLCAYSELLSKLQEIQPTKMHLVLGGGEKHSYWMKDFYYYYIRAKQRFEKFIQKLPDDSYPEPCSQCKYCRWIEGCEEKWQEDNHLSLVANIQRSQIDKLRKAGIDTMAELATSSAKTTIPNLNQGVFQRLRAQAILQQYKQTNNKNKYEIVATTEGKGFSRLPMPDPGDLFLDLEGDPLYPDGLEYLFGVYFHKNGEGVFKPFWAHNHAEEKAVFNEFMKFLDSHLRENPKANIYHYNHYETTALKRLSCRYAICEEQIDNLLRNQKFIDLYQVVRESIRTSESGYSLKDLETFYMEERDSTVATASDSIIVYNEWRESGVDELLDDIANYNEEDCVSTQLLRDWLLDLKPENSTWFNDFGESVEYEDNSEQFRRDWEIEYEQVHSLLGVDKKNTPEINKTVANLLEFHRREEKSQWWSYFERLNKFEEELIDDAECLGGLEKINTSETMKHSPTVTYKFPPQDYKLKVGSEAASIEETRRNVKIEEIDDKVCTVELSSRSFGGTFPEKLSIGPKGPINTKLLRSAIYNFAYHLLGTENSPHVSTELLMRNLPRIQNKRKGEAIITSDQLIQDALDAIISLDDSYLFIQGPPGTGKTYTSGNIIVELMTRGYKVGITSNSHKAIHNLLDMVERIADEKGLQFCGIKKATRGFEESNYSGEYIHSVTVTGEMNLEANLFAGSAWTFANPHFRDELDYLFIDEAGQVSTANVVAMSNATNNIVLVGDQMQLGQPIQGTHPGESGLSVLEFLLGDQATIPDDRGIFLGTTWRMRPSVCQFVSDAFYDGRLTTHESTMKRSLNLKNVDLPNEGVVSINAYHEGCSQKSEVEGEIIKAKYQDLLGQSFTDQNGMTRPITEEDILVVAPYNVQVNHLTSILPDDARVGTIDKFQGQEAPIVLVSMTTSSSEYLPRNIEFLYSKNRLNVAISRAQCLAIVVYNPNLLEVPCNTIEQIKLVNTFCWLDDFAVHK